MTNHKKIVLACTLVTIWVASLVGCDVPKERYDVKELWIKQTGTQRQLESLEKSVYALQDQIDALADHTHAHPPESIHEPLPTPEPPETSVLVEPCPHCIGMLDEVTFDDQSVNDNAVLTDTVITPCPHCK